MPSLWNLPTQICFAFFLQLLISKVKEKYLLSLTAFCDSMRARMQRTNYIFNSDPSNPALNKAQISNYPRLQYQTCSWKTVKNSAILLSHSFYHFLPAFCVWSILCLNWWVWLVGQYFKTVWALSYPNIQNTPEISHIFFHWYKFPNDDKVKLCVLS